MQATVIGLGMMGGKLASLLLAAGWEVTVWNRSPAAAGTLVREGATLASSAAHAVQASGVLVMCVKDYAAAQAILEGPGVADALRGRTLVHLSTGSPQEATAMQEWVRRQGGEYLAGAIQAAPEQMGTPTTPILVSGRTSAFAAAQPALQLFGGSVTHLGEAASLACAMDFATLSYVYGATIGFFHGVRIAESEGLGVDTYAALVGAIAPSFGDFLRHEGNMIHAGNFAISQSPLRISVDATERIARHARDRGIHSAVPDLAARLFRQAMEAGYAGEEAAAVIKVMREPA